MRDNIQEFLDLLEIYERALWSIADSACCSACQEAALVAKKALLDALRLTSRHR